LQRRFQRTYFFRKDPCTDAKILITKYGIHPEAAEKDLGNEKKNKIKIYGEKLEFSFVTITAWQS